MSTPPLIGRRQVLARVQARLQAGARLVTLVGPGGVGKTRLARALVEARPDAVWCDLSPARDATDVCALAARALDLQGVEGDLAARVGAALRGRSDTLFVLDNFEQVAAAAAPLVDAWTRAAPGAAFLVTSRQPLGLTGEISEPIEPLRGADAVRLFRERAPVSVPEGALARVAAVVRRLDGLPLAIELAAARLSVLSLEDLDDRLRDRFRVLRDPSAPVDARHGALWQAIDWSWQLLAPWEQQALAHCSVFAGDFDLAAAEAVLPPDPPAMDALQSLAHKSLVRLTATDGARRFGLFESVRAYAADKLGEDRAEAMRRHAAYFVALGERLAAQAYGHEGAAALDGLERARDDLRAIARAGGIPGLRGALALSALLSTRDPPGPHADALRAALAGAPEASVALRARAHLELGRALRHQGRIAEGEAEMGRAASLAHEAGEAGVEALAAAQLANLLIMANRPTDARAVAETARLQARDAGEARAECLAISALALIDLNAGRTGEAQAWCEEGLRRLTPVGDARLTGILLLFLADAYQDQDRLDEARSVLEQALSVFSAAGFKALTATTRANLGTLHHLQGRLVEARAAYDAARAVLAAHGEPRLESFQRLYTGILLAETGALDEAERSLVEAERQNAAAGEARYAVLILTTRAAVRALRGDRAGAEAARVEATSALERGSDPALAAALDVPAGLLDLEGGARDRAADRLARAESAPSFDVRLLARVLRRAWTRAEDDARAWFVARDGRRFAPPGEASVSLDHRAPLMLMLATLARRRVESPGAGLTVPELAAAAWPGEKLIAQAAANRVHVALSTLRKLGLGPLLGRDGAAYRLDPDVPLRVVGD